MDYHSEYNHLSDYEKSILGRIFRRFGRMPGSMDLLSLQPHERSILASKRKKSGTAGRQLPLLPTDK